MTMNSNNIIDDIRSICDDSCGKPDTYFNKQWQHLKDCNEYNNIIRGSELGLTAYQKPSRGIPKSDLSLELQALLTALENSPSGTVTSQAFGIVRYNKVTHKIHFYAPNDTKCTRILGTIDVDDLPKGPRGPQGPRGPEGPEGPRGFGITQDMIDQLSNLQKAAELVTYLEELVKYHYPHKFLEKEAFDQLISDGEVEEGVIYLIHEND